MDALPVPVESERAVAQKISEVEAIADRLAFVYRQSVNFYVKQHGLSPAEASLTRWRKPTRSNSNGRRF